MSQDNSCLAEAINLPQSPATVLLPVSYWQTIAEEVKRLRDEMDSLDQDLKRFKVFTKTGEVDDLKERITILEEAIMRLTPGPRDLGKLQANRLKKLDYLLTSRSNEAMTFSEIGKILELGRRDEKVNTRRQAMTKFGKILEAKKDCYEVTNCTTRSGKQVKLIRDYYQHCKKELFGV